MWTHLYPNNQKEIPDKLDICSFTLRTRQYIFQLSKVEQYQIIVMKNENYDKLLLTIFFQVYIRSDFL